MELKTNNNKRFWFTISVYLIIGLYLLFIIYSKPFINIEVKEENGVWKITNPYYKDWALKQQIEIGDNILSVNGNNIDKITNLKYDLVIRSANEITIMKPNGELKEIKIKPFDITQQFYSVLLVPTSYYLLSLLISIYLYLKPKNTILINLLILFILSVSLAYLSIGASGILNPFGIIVNRGSMLLCLVLLLKFLKEYFGFLNIRWPFIKNINSLYILPIAVIILSIFGIVYDGIHSIVSSIILGLFFLLLVAILSIMIFSYVKYRIPELKILLSSIIIPFIPFLFLYALPEIFFHNQILSADISSIFLLLIPFSFIFTQLTERIFDMEYFISRLRYYFNFSFGFTIWLLIGLYLFADLSVSHMTEIFFFAFLSLMALFYIKERIDYRKRKILFSTKGDYIHRLYTTVESIGRVVKIEDLLEKFVQEVVVQLEMESVYVLTYDFQTHQVTLTNKSKEYTQHQIDEVLVERLGLGDIKKTDHFYIAFIHQDVNYKRILVVDHNKTIYLKDEELLWLELLLLYLNNFIENTKMVEELLNQLKHMKEADNRQLPWLNKLLWLRFEEEKYQLAQELHDTILQEQLHIAREMDVLMHTKEKEEIPSKLIKLHEHMIISLNDLRGYCENLKPPLLDTLGLNAALEKLIQKIHKRANFVLIYTIDRLYLEDERLNLMIYRLFQELLNNALKHSYANTVEIHLLGTEEGFQILYSDDGVGCNIDDILLADSMGIQGMQERVQAFNGKFALDSKVGEGMTIRIQVSETQHTNPYTYKTLTRPTYMIRG
ncbi:MULTISPECIES: sensor histidine kinase [Lysinibacillus]|uniref:sensor histidine kinase n=1 Tax=Lysinibacillus TaxID=400634 RepID=UPI001C8B4DDA|nr:MULTISPECIES: ATP-binding protein [Lysinibacillus]MBX8943390.1 histidine kinase [Lysinibacillus sp. K60]UUV22940.1 histidine kinase [Lysinibacillus sp. FN11]UYB45803.1 histidine kinase [Lysinibacillus capsici]WDU78006.1 histidine kinase [Lysinibacillus sp. G01H]